MAVLVIPPQPPPPTLAERWIERHFVGWWHRPLACDSKDLLIEPEVVLWLL